MLTINDPSTPSSATTHTTIESGLGDLTVVGRAGWVIGLYFAHHWYRPDPAGFGPTGETAFDEVRTQLGEYLCGARRSFDLPLLTAGDVLQERVWALTRSVPYGETATYGELARELGGGATPQEVGAAVGRNPLCILIPCHRIVGAAGQLTGYAGGLARKRFLLDLEADTSGRTSRLF